MSERRSRRRRTTPPSGLIPDQEFLRHERAKARELRRSAWWKRRCAPGVCFYCGRHVGSARLTMDHIVPLARGGRTTKGNVVPACKDCNTRKKSSLAFEPWE